MKVYYSINELQEALNQERSLTKSLGFVPTMGALHQGHISLVKQAASHCDVVIVSIFVNPTQFNDKNDLINYPRDLQKDLQLLQPSGCSYVFAPSVEEIYPEPDTRQFQFGSLESVMEGAFRPGHFNGVAQVVSRLFDIVKPDLAFFGQKDFQQLAIIRQLVRQHNYPITIVGCPIIREEDGLAMSSRNMLLLPEYRKVAPLIFKTLDKAKSLKENRSVEQVKQWVIDQINGSDLLRVEYFELVDQDTLETLNNWSEGQAVGCIAVYAGKIRLIDNIVF